MTGERSGVGETILTAAAAGLLAVSAVTARGDVKRSSPAQPARPEPGLALSEPGLKGKVERIQATSQPLSFTVGVVKKFGDDRASRLAALVAYYGFFSLFPALLALVTILGFVLKGNDHLRTSISNSALAQFPVIGESIGSTASKPLTGNTLALIIGLLGALWAGLGAMQMSQDALNTVWDVPREEQPKFLPKRLRSLGGLVLVAVLFAATAFVPRFATAVSSGAIGWVVALLLTMVWDMVVLLCIFRLLTAVKVEWRVFLPGAIVAGIAYVVLQSLGTLYVTHTLKGAQKTYGTFAGVIGLLSWMYLLAQVTMFAAEVNVVRHRRLWPRSLFGPDHLTKRLEEAAGAA
jgi:membrane protein